MNDKSNDNMTGALDNAVDAIQAARPSVADIEAAANRVRTDLGRVKEIWAPRFPKEYLQWYGEYRHDMNGLLILD